MRAVVVIAVACAGCKQILGLGDLPPDAARIADAQRLEVTSACYGTSGFGPICFAEPLPISVSLAGAIDTDTSPLCSTDADVPNGMCIVAARDVAVGDVHATGSRPLVILADATVNVTGALDVASHRLPKQRGAGANAAACVAQTIASGGGGGAGGSFGTSGGNGGAGSGFMVSVAGPMQPASQLRGGCPGQSGQTDPLDGGDGGGAVYLVADESIAIAMNAAIDASGAGAYGAAVVGEGGGGGGAGGLVALDAPIVTNDGTIYAGGGGGGQGADMQIGADGDDPIGIGAAAGGAAANPDGGDGGSGGSASFAGAAGQSGVNNAGGGGGGGGVGYVKLFGAQTIGGSGAISPAPS